MLGSEDIEMVRLGASLMQGSVPKSYWKAMLAEYVKPFLYTITEDNIVISDIIGLWQQLSSNYKSTYKYEIMTGIEGMNMIQDILK